MEDKKALTAPCGLACFLCDIHESNLTDELAETIHNEIIQSLPHQKDRT